MNWIWSLTLMLVIGCSDLAAQSDSYVEDYIKPKVKVLRIAKHQASEWLAAFGPGLGIPSTIKLGKLYFSPNEMTFYGLDTLFEENDTPDRADVDLALRAAEGMEMYDYESVYFNTRSHLEETIHLEFDAHGNLIWCRIYQSNGVEYMAYDPKGNAHDPYRPAKR